VSFLVVEGSPSTRDALCYALLSMGVKGVPAATRAAAWDAINAATDLEGAIVDIDNKDVDGISLVADLRQQPRTKGLAVIVHTIQSGKDFVLQMIEAGVAGYLLKPFEASRTREKLSPILAKISTHNGERRHFRVKPDPGDLARVHFRLNGVAQLLSGKILDVSLGGMAVELLTPPAEGVLQTGTHIPRLEFALGGRELAPEATVVLLKLNVLALKFDSIAAADTRSLERYIFKKISS
jgi:two-component system, chemotaxis family, chemotaxis protein CheY